MSSILKVDQLQDSGGNNLITSDGSGNVTSVGFNNAGGLVLLSSQTASGDASINFTSNIDSTYKIYVFKLYRSIFYF